jgi:CubicO group peptidase (beta-lactamase class C family)
MRKRLLSAVSLALTAAIVNAQGPNPPPDWKARVDQVFAEFSQGASPGCALAIYRDGAIAYERGYGYADLEHDIPITPESVFYVGSLSKQFTAFAAALAIQQGALAYEDDVRKYVPELPEYGAPIRIRHLIHHTSGLRDINTLMALAGRRGDEAFDNHDVLRVVARQKSLNFTPGEEFLYTNSGYAVLALAIERATGVPFGTFAEERIFKPLGMTATHFHDDQSRLVRHRADAYARIGGAIRLETPVNERAGAGGVFANVRDLLHWDENFYTGRVGGRDLVQRVQTPGRLNSGREQTYAWGLTIGAYRGQRAVLHGGSLGGYRAHLTRFPDQHVSVACLCNMASIAPAQLVDRVADIYLAGVLAGEAGAGRGGRGGRGRAGGAAPEPAAPPALAPGRLAEYVGTYYSDELDATYTVLVQENRLVLRRVSPAASPLTPAAVDAFTLGAQTVRFLRGAGGRVEGLAVDAGRVRDIRFVKR